jgi:hypothetical protein
MIMAKSDESRPCTSRSHPPGETVPCAPELRVCAGCRNAIEELLVELPTLFDSCAHALEQRSGGPNIRVSGNRPESIELRDTVVSVRTEMLGTLASWCRLVSGERGVTAPNELTPHGLVRFLAVHLQWLCGQTIAPDAVDELAGLATRAHEALAPQAPFRVTAGTCLHPGCGQTVHVHSHDEGGTPYAVVCEHGHEAAPRDWLRLRAGSAEADPQEAPLAALEGSA